MLKTNTLGYDGKGQKVLRQPADVQHGDVLFAQAPAPA
ncbi:hypothetical protein [Klebsiella pneumoniae]